MYALLARIARLLQNTTANHEDESVAHQLMESADACAGNSPHHAQELRDAASAYLSVVR
jgi:regulator of sirC expression with transglutaminase-like and TPR domain